MDGGTGASVFSDDLILHIEKPASVNNTIRTDTQARIKEIWINIKKCRHAAKAIRATARDLARFCTKLSRHNLR